MLLHYILSLVLAAVPSGGFRGIGLWNYQKVLDIQK